MKDLLTTHLKAIQKIDEMCLLDDAFMRECLQDNIPAVQKIVQIVLGDDSIRIQDVKTQYDVVNLGGRSLKIDVVATDQADSSVFNIEIQRDDGGAVPERGRYHASMLDATCVKKGMERFTDLPDNSVIFITEHDIYKSERPLYTVSRTIKELDQRPYNDRSKIYYVNTAYGDTRTDLGKLAHDFRCKNPDDMYIEELRSSVDYFKKTREGRAKMGTVFEDFAREMAIITEINTRREFSQEEEKIKAVIMKKYQLSSQEADEFMKEATEQLASA